MKLSGATPQTQVSGKRPISFILDDGGVFSAPVTLVLRPEDLTRTEPARASVYQTMGRDISGWVDHFGSGLPSVTIAGHTGWRDVSGRGMDGAAAFAALNQLVAHDFPAAKQAAIDKGLDPGAVKLLFIDDLDGFAWSVVPNVFTLRRNKASPLLIRYNIVMQAVSTSVDRPKVITPDLGSESVGLGALDRAIAKIQSFAGKVESWVKRALDTVDGVLGPIAKTIKNFVGLANTVFGAVNSVVRSVSNLGRGLANRVIAIAGDVANVGRNIFRSFNAIRNLPADLKASLGRVASAFNEVACIFKNSLRPRKTYEEYSGLYGASNCSSTTGGRQDSAYANLNAFQQMQGKKDVVTANAAALAGISTLKNADPVLAPVPLQEIGRHTTNIVTGLAL